MTAVYCFSGSGHSRAVAEHIARRLGLAVTNMENADMSAVAHINTVAAVFPVYSDNIPAPAREFLRSFRCANAALIAVYGGVSHGNVLTQAAELCRSQVICGAYVPCGHTYLDEAADFDRAALEPIIDRIKLPQKAILPKERQSLLGRLLPEVRARMLVRIVRGEECDGCGLCVRVCPVSAMHSGKPDSKCLRCLRCVNACPKKALQAEYVPLLKAYLRRKRHSSAEIYL